MLAQGLKECHISSTNILLVDIGLPGLGSPTGIVGDPYLVGSAFGADISCLGWGPQTSGDLAEVWFDQLRD